MGSIEERLDLSIVDGRWRWRFHLSLDEVVVVGGKQVAARVLIDGWIECPDINAFLDPSSKIIVLGVNDFKIIFAEVMVEITRMLHDGRFTLARATKGSGKMFVYA